MSGSRSKIVAGNWKCNGTGAVVAELLATFNQVPVADGVEVVIAPTYLHISLAQSQARNPKLEIAAQNAHLKSGAFTGEVSADALVDAGVKTVILGHSERRNVFGESDALVGEKAAVCLAKGMRVMVCIGESKDEFSGGRTEEVLARQLTAILDKVGAETWKRHGADKIVLPYEPIYAIGTGLACEPEQAQKTSAFIRAWVSEKVAPEVGAKTKVLYGGSVTGKNSGVYMGQADIDGVLVGGASLKPDFVSIINSAAPANSNL